MKYLRTLACLPLIALTAATAQNVPQEPLEDPVQKAIREFNLRDSGKPNEVTVVIAPPVETDSKEPDGGPVLVTRQTAPEPEPAETTAAATGSTTAPDSPEPARGPTIRVEKLHANGQDYDASKVKLRAPFPAKPLSTAPKGWRIETSEHAPPFNREIELEPGKSITLSVRPHILVPDVDGATSFAIPEPGFDPSLGYEQAATVSAILSKSVRQLETDSRDLGVAIDTLQQILVALPQPESVPKQKN